MNRPNKYTNLSIIADIFYKCSAIKFPPEAKWVPKEFSEHKLFKDYPQEKLQKVFKDYGLDDFRTKIDAKILKSQSFSKVYSVMITNLVDSEHKLGNFLKTYMKTYHPDIYRIEKLDDDRIKPALSLNEIMNKFKVVLNHMKKSGQDTFKIPGNIRTMDKSIRYDKDASIIKVYNDINNRLAKLYKEFGGGLLLNEIKMPPIESYEAFSALSKSQYKFELVFSTDLMDLAGISDRGISSCMSLHDEATQCSRITDHNQHLIGAILSRFVGVCYITSGKTIESRGEQMLYRALIRQVLSIETNEPAIYIDQLYPAEQKEIYDIMKVELQKRSKIPVISSYSDPFKTPTYTFIYPGEKYYEPEDENVPDQFQSYRDPGLGYTLSQLRALKYNTDFRQRGIAANKLPLAEIKDMLFDENEDIREFVVTRLMSEGGMTSDEVYKLQTGDDEEN